MGELNKLAANISIGRNMAGVHYFSDYYDSLRMGEEIAEGEWQRFDALANDVEHAFHEITAQRHAASDDDGVEQ